jgi:hypothetical protein
MARNRHDDGRREGEDAFGELEARPKHLQCLIPAGPEDGEIEARREDTFSSGAWSKAPLSSMNIVSERAFSLPSSIATMAISSSTR